MTRGGGVCEVKGIPSVAPAAPYKVMTDEQLLELNAKLDRILPIIEALGSVVIRRKDVVDRAGLNKNTLNGKDMLEEVGKRKTYIAIGEIPVVKRRKGTRNASR